MSSSISLVILKSLHWLRYSIRNTIIPDSKSKFPQHSHLSIPSGANGDIHTSQALDLARYFYNLATIFITWYITRQAFL